MHSKPEGFVAAPTKVVPFGESGTGSSWAQVLRYGPETRLATALDHSLRVGRPCQNDVG